MTTEVISLSGTSTGGPNAVDFDIESQYDGCNITIEHAFTIKALPDNKTCIPDEPVLKHWQHLSDVKPIRIPGNRVDLLHDTNVSEAHWIFERRKGHQRIRMRI